MANIPYIAGKSAYLIVKLGGTKYSIPVVAGTVLSAPTNNRLLTAASAMQAGAGASNKVSGIVTPTLHISTLAMPSFFTKAFLDALLLTRNAQGDLAEAQIAFFNGTNLLTDTGKAAAIRIDIDRSSQVVGLGLDFLLSNAAPTAGTFETNGSDYTHPRGEGFLACNVAFSFGYAAVYGSTGETITLGTGAFGQKFSGDGRTCKQLSNIAAGALAGGVTVNQGAGADIAVAPGRLDAYDAGIMKWAFTDGPALTIGVDRVNKGLPINPEGSQDVLTQWQAYGGNHAGVFVVTA